MPPFQQPTSSRSHSKSIRPPPYQFGSDSPQITAPLSAAQFAAQFAAALPRPARPVQLVTRRRKYGGEDLTYFFANASWFVLAAVVLVFGCFSIERCPGNDYLPHWLWLSGLVWIFVVSVFAAARFTIKADGGPQPLGEDGDVEGTAQSERLYDIWVAVVMLCAAGNAVCGATLIRQTDKQACQSEVYNHSVTFTIFQALVFLCFALLASHTRRRRKDRKRAVALGEV